MKVKRRKTRTRRPRHPNPKPESFAVLVRRAFQTRSKKGTGGLTREELLDTAIQKAQRGDFYFWSKLIDLHETRELLTEDDLQRFIERIYVTVRRHVEKLEGGKEVLAEIARDLKHQKESENE